MENEFVSYEIALALKELGFDEPCFTYYYNITNNIRTGLSINIHNAWTYAGTQKLGITLAPTFSQAFKFFREKYSIRHSIMDFIDDEIGIEWDYEIATIGTDLDENGHYEALIGYSIDDENRKFNTYEEAQLDCLRKLIKLVKL